MKVKKRKTSRREGTEEHSADHSHLAKLLLKCFSGREDVHATEMPRGFRPVRERISEGDLTEHLAGEHCRAFYVMRSDNTVLCSCVDLDDKGDIPDPKIDAETVAIVEALAKAKLQALTEVSQSGRGRHIWLFFSTPISAQTIRSFWDGVSRCINVRFKEVYPRQDKLSGKGLGNCVRYPLWNESHFVDVAQGWQKLAPEDALASVQRLSEEDVKAAAERLGVTLKEVKQRGTRGKRSRISRSSVASLDRLIKEYGAVEKGRRSEAHWAILKEAIRQEISPEDLWEKVKDVV